MWKFWGYTVDEKHGLGIFFYKSYMQERPEIFYEDGSLLTGERDADRDSAIRVLLDPENAPIRSRSTSRKAGKKQQSREEPLSDHFTCRFFPEPKEDIGAEIHDGERHWRIQISSNGYRFWSVSCSCGVPECAHLKAVQASAMQRIQSLLHNYVVSPLPVYKGYFLEPSLSHLLDTFPHYTSYTSPDAIRHTQQIILLMDSACSEDYYYLVHDEILSRSPSYGYYIPHYLEENYAFLLLALFENPGYQAAVLADGSYAEADTGEERQYKSNRASLKRVLKDYNKITKELDIQHNYEAHPYKEFLLKFRNDRPGLLRYFVESKPALEPSDIPFLEQISEASDVDPAYVPAIIGKLDALNMPGEAAPLFTRFLQMLPPAERVELYPLLRNYTMPLEDARKAAVAAVKKLGEDVGIVMSLKGVVKDEDIDQLAADAFKDACTPGNPKPVSPEIIKELYLSLMK